LDFVSWLIHGFKIQKTRTKFQEPDKISNLKFENQN